jgi:hypothetical protein
VRVGPAGAVVGGVMRVYEAGRAHAVVRVDALVRRAAVMKAHLEAARCAA